MYLKNKTLRIILLCVLLVGCDTGRPKTADLQGRQDTPQASRQIEQFCGHCHAFPKPNSFARDEWRAEVAQGYRFYEGAPHLKLDAPPEDEVIAFYEAAAPLSIPEPSPREIEPRCRFQIKTVDHPATAVSISGLSRKPGTDELWAPDMRTGAILKSDSEGRFSEEVRPVEFANPCRLTWTDLDRNGQPELLVCDLGSFFPQDHQNGAIWSLDPSASSKSTPVLQGVSRIADAQTGDLDGDGDLDLVVAEFGWRRTGRLLIVWNSGNPDFATWKQLVLDQRHGAIDVPLVDLNGDGRLDVVVLFSQEFEMVVAFLNQGEGQFARQTIYAADEPSFGSSGIQLVDLDQDGDFDVVHSNGDSFDSSYVKPFHGVRWLENRGQYPFAVHDVVSMPGVHRTVAGDLDLDGDLDLASVSLLPPAVLQKWRGLPSVMWMENTGEGAFKSHVVEIDSAHHASCELIDIDRDEDLDLVATNFRWQETGGTPVTWFINQTPHDEIAPR